MFTRKKKALAIAIYIISFIVLNSFFGESGFICSSSLKREQEELQGMEEKKIADIMLLRAESMKEHENRSGGELVYSFSDEWESEDAAPQDEIEDPHAFSPLSLLSVFFLSLIPAVLYISAASLAYLRRSNEGSSN